MVPVVITATKQSEPALVIQSRKHHWTQESASISFASTTSERAKDPTSAALTPTLAVLQDRGGHGSMKEQNVAVKEIFGGDFRMRLYELVKEASVMALAQ